MGEWVAGRNTDRKNGKEGRSTILNIWVDEF